MNTQILENKNLPKDLKLFISNHKKINDNPEFSAIIDQLEYTYNYFNQFYGTQESQFSELYIKLLDDIEEVSDIKTINKIIDVVFNLQIPLFNNKMNKQLQRYIKGVMADFNQNMEKIYTGEKINSDEFFFNLGRSRAITDIFVDDRNNRKYYDDVKFLRMNLQENKRLFDKHF